MTNQIHQELPAPADPWAEGNGPVHQGGFIDKDNDPHERATVFPTLALPEGAEPETQITPLPTHDRNKTMGAATLRVLSTLYHNKPQRFAADYQAARDALLPPDATRLTPVVPLPRPAEPAAEPPQPYTPRHYQPSHAAQYEAKHSRV